VDFCNEKLIKHPQKEHRCEGCCKKMPRNRKHWYVSGVWEGDFFTARLCFACSKHLDKYSKNYRDGWSRGDFKEGRLEAIRDYKWRRSERIDKA